MPILVSDIVSRIQANGLDAQPDTGYYSVPTEIIPAIDSAQKWLVSAVDKLRSNNKDTDEVIKELASSRVFTTSVLSRIVFDDSIWTIDAVQPLPATASNGTTPPTPPTDQYASYENTDLMFVSSWYSASRKTIEEAGENRNNPFAGGFQPPNIPANTLVEGSSLNVDFMYVAPYAYTNPSTSTGFYIEIQPYIPRKKCAIFCILKPIAITQTNQSLQFPTSMFNLVYEKALQFLSYSQGDQTNIWEVTDNDIQTLLNSIS